MEWLVNNGVGVKSWRSTDQDTFTAKLTPASGAMLRSAPGYAGRDWTGAAARWAPHFRRDMNRRLAVLHQVANANAQAEAHGGSSNGCSGVGRVPSHVMHWRAIIQSMRAAWDMRAHDSNSPLQVNGIAWQTIQQWHKKIAARAKTCECANHDVAHTFDDGRVITLDPECPMFDVVLNVALGWVLMPPESPAEISKGWQNANSATCRQWEQYGAAAFDKGVDQGWYQLVDAPTHRRTGWSLAVRNRDQRAMRRGDVANVKARACMAAHEENVRVSDVPLRFDTTDEICAQFNAMDKPENARFVTLDWKSWYKSHHLAPVTIKQLGVLQIPTGKFKGRWVKQLRAPFGLKSSVACACAMAAIAHEVWRFRAQTELGIAPHNLVGTCWIDDSLIGADKTKIDAVLALFIDVCADLGFTLAPDKTSLVTAKPTYTGMVYDFPAGRITLPEDRWDEFADTLEEFLARRVVSKKQLEAVMGVRSWAARVRPAARLRLHSGWALLRAFRWSRTVQMSKHLRQDTLWDLADFRKKGRQLSRICCDFRHRSAIWVDSSGDDMLGVGAVLCKPDDTLVCKRWPWRSRMYRKLKRHGKDSSTAREATGGSLAVKDFVATPDDTLSVGDNTALVINFDNASAAYAFNTGSTRSYLVRRALHRATDVMLGHGIAHVAFWRPRSSFIRFVDIVGRTFAGGWQQAVDAAGEASSVPRRWQTPQASLAAAPRAATQRPAVPWTTAVTMRADTPQAPAPRAPTLWEAAPRAAAPRAAVQAAGASATVRFTRGRHSLSVHALESPQAAPFVPAHGHKRRSSIHTRGTQRDERGKLRHKLGTPRLKRGTPRPKHGTQRGKRGSPKYKHCMLRDSQPVATPKWAASRAMTSRSDASQAADPKAAARLSAEPDGEKVLSLRAGSCLRRRAGFVVHEVGDGHCMYRAFARQLLGSPERYQELRRRCCRQLLGKKGWRRYNGALVGESLHARTRCILQGAWANHLEMQALADAYDAVVQVWRRECGGDFVLRNVIQPFGKAAQRHVVRLMYNVKPGKAVGTHFDTFQLHKHTCEAAGAEHRTARHGTAWTCVKGKSRRAA